MKVKLYTFDKKYNSTKRPTATGTEFECLLKTSSSIISPTIELNIGLVSNPSAYNYAYIQDYGRYYWVGEWTFIDTSWVALLTVDVLATWRPYIAETDMYVYRSSAEKNGNLADMKYPTTTNETFSKVDISLSSSPIDTRYDFTKGCFILSVYGENTNNTSLSYYVFTPSGMASFLEHLYQNSLSDAEWGNTIAIGIRNSLYDVSSYLKACKWLPKSAEDFVDTTSPITSIKVGGCSIPCVCYELPASVMRGGLSIDRGYNVISIPHHPQASVRGNYCNLSPFSKYKLIFMPFGVFEIDGAYLNGFANIITHVRVDPVTGVGFLTVNVREAFDGTPHEEYHVLTATTNYCIDVPLTISDIDLMGGLSSMLQGFTQALFGNLGGLIIGEIAGVSKMLLPEVQTNGVSKGGFTGLNYEYNAFQARFFTIADDNNAIFGRPLCATRKPKNIAGYIEGRSDNFSCPATDSEQSEIRRFIDNGFYYE